MPFTQIIAFKSYFDNLEKPLNSTLSGASLMSTILFESVALMWILNEAFHILAQLGDRLRKF